MKQQLREIAFMTLLEPMDQRANSFIHKLFICLFTYAQKFEKIVRTTDMFLFQMLICFFLNLF